MAGVFQVHSANTKTGLKETIKMEMNAYCKDSLRGGEKVVTVDTYFISIDCNVELLVA